MRFSTLALVSTVASVQSLSSGVHAWSMIPQRQRQSALSSNTRARSTSLPTATGRSLAFYSTKTQLSASIAPEEVDLSPFSQQDPGTSIAEGAIVSYFAGGLAAVKIDDEHVFAPKAPGAAIPATAKAASSKNGDDLVGRLAKLSTTGSLGVVIAQRPPIVFCFFENNPNAVEEGTVEIMNTMAEVSVAKDVRIFNAFGPQTPSTTIDMSIDTKDAAASRAIFAPIPKVSDIALINSPVLTGTTMVDVLAPIGRGQNMLLVGSNVDEMRTLAFTMCKTQLASSSSKKRNKCIYAATSDSATILRKLEEANLLQEDVTVVAARDDLLDAASRAAEATLVAGTACAIAESFAGEDTLVIVDTLDHHKDLWDVTTRVLVDIYGVDAVVAADREGGASSEMRAFYSSLIQRAANYKATKNGGGSITLLLMVTIPGRDGEDDDSKVFEPSDFANYGDKIKARLDVLVKKNIPLTAATLRKIQVPLPSLSEGKRRMVLQHVDDLISMSDGQIWLDSSRDDRAISWPPMDVSRSITRIGIGADTESRADAPAIRRIAQGVRMELAQANDAAAAAQNSKWSLAMQQDAKECRTLSESCILLQASSMGLLVVKDTDNHKTPQSELLVQYVQSRIPQICHEINDTLDISTPSLIELKETIQSYYSEESK